MEEFSFLEIRLIVVDDVSMFLGVYDKYIKLIEEIMEIIIYICGEII